MTTVTSLWLSFSAPSSSSSSSSSSPSASETTVLVTMTGVQRRHSGSTSSCRGRAFRQVMWLVSSFSRRTSTSLIMTSEGKKKCQNSCMGSTLCYMYSGFRPVSSPLQHVQPVQGGGDVLRTDAGQFAEVSDGNLLIAELVHALQHHAPPVGHVGQPPQVRQGLLWRSWLALALRQQVA